MNELGFIIAFVGLCLGVFGIGYRARNIIASTRIIWMGNATMVLGLFTVILSWIFER